MNEVHCVLLSVTLLVPHLDIGSWFSGMRTFPLPCRAWQDALAGEGILWVHTEQVHKWISF